LARCRRSIAGSTSRVIDLVCVVKCDYVLLPTLLPSWGVPELMYVDRGLRACCCMDDSCCGL
jgi:hypothetical protein